MTGRISIALALLWLVAVAAPPSFDDFRLVLERNVFDATRQPRREAPPPQIAPPPPAPVAKTLTLVGVFIADERALALFVDAKRTSTVVALGEEVEGMALGALDSTGVEWHLDGGKTLRMAVGERLSDGGTGAWEVVGRSEQAPSVQQEQAERQAASQAELLQRLMERRKRELGQ